MGEVFIVEAVRSPLGRRNGGLSTVHPADLLGSRAEGGRRARRHRARRGRPGRRRLRVPGGRAVVQHRPERLAHRRAARSRCPRPPSTASAARASRRARWPPVWSGSGLEDVVLSCGIESMSRIPLGANFQSHGSAGAEELLRELRLQQPVPGRRADRQGVRHHPRRHRRLRPAQPAARPAGLGRGALRARDRARSTRRSSTRTASPPARPCASTRRGPARHLPREAGDAQGR